LISGLQTAISIQCQLNGQDASVPLVFYLNHQHASHRLKSKSKANQDSQNILKAPMRKNEEGNVLD